MSAAADPISHTTQPVVTGTSVLGLKFDGGVAFAADCLGSYGSLARFRDVRRLIPAGKNTIVGGSGDVADFDAIKDMLNALIQENDVQEDGFEYGPKSIHSYMTRVLYHKRSNMKPLWNVLLVGGVEADGKAFLGYVDKIGVAYQDDTISTGYGAHIATPLLRSAQEANPNMTKEEAVAVLERCMKVLYYRDARSLNRYQIATITQAGMEISEPKSAETSWSIASMVKGYE